MEFSNPSIGRFDLTPYALQSEEYYDAGASMSDTLGSPEQVSTHRALVNFGESIKSFRTLMRRQNHLDTIVVPTPVTSSGTYLINQTRFPAHYGFDPSGWNVSKGVLVPASNFAFNFINTIPWHLISNCFLAQRGSTNWTFNPVRGDSSIVSRVARYNLTFSSYSNYYQNGLNTTDNIQEYNYWYFGTATNAGASLTHTKTTSGHAVCAPSYSPFKFQTTHPQATTNPGAPSSALYDGSVYDTLRIEYPFNSTTSPIAGATIERYFGIGADYTLHFFMNCPTLNYLSASSLVPV